MTTLNIHTECLNSNQCNKYLDTKEVIQGIANNSITCSTDLSTARYKVQLQVLEMADTLVENKT